MPTQPTSRRRVRLWRFVLFLIVVIGAFAFFSWHTTKKHSNETTLSIGDGKTVLLPKYPGLSPLRKRIVAIAESQIGYKTDPADSYCNKFSAYWYSGQSICGNNNLSEEWCADFAAWVWEKAGAEVTYQYINGDLNSSSASFYEWGVRLGTWHPVGSNYIPQPGDVAVYGLNAAALVATHVAVVIGYVRGSKGPIAINGDGDLTGHSVVEVRTDEHDADVHPRGAALAGYVSPS